MKQSQKDRQPRQPQPPETAQPAKPTQKPAEKPAGADRVATATALEEDFKIDPLRYCGA